jgi:hypothetical protein
MLVALGSRLRSNKQKNMKKLILPIIAIAFLVSCSGSTEENAETNSTPAAPNLSDQPIQTREYKGGWAGVKYSVTFDVNLFSEERQSGSYHDFRINNGGSTPGYISVSTVRMDSDTQKAHELVNAMHKNLKGELLGEAQVEVAPEKFGENEVYLFTDKAMSGFGQDAIILCKGEAIHIKFQTQGPEEPAIEKDKAAFKVFLSSVRVY